MLPRVSERYGPWPEGYDWCRDVTRSDSAMCLGQPTTWQQHGSITLGTNVAITRPRKQMKQVRLSDNWPKSMSPAFRSRQGPHCGLRENDRRSSRRRGYVHGNEAVVARVCWYAWHLAACRRYRLRGCILSTWSQPVAGRQRLPGTRISESHHTEAYERIMFNRREGSLSGSDSEEEEANVDGSMWMVCNRSRPVPRKRLLHVATAQISS